MTKSIHSTAELARHLGLSRWTVSRAINGQGGVGPDTIAAVRRAMQEFGFTPSPHARGLRGQRTGVIGVCFRALDTPVTIQKIARVQKLIGERGYLPMFGLTGGTPDQGLNVLTHFVSMRVEGVLLVDAPPDDAREPWLKLLHRNRIPTALLEPRGPSAYNAVHLDREQAMKEIVEHLLGLGHTHFGLLGISGRFPLGQPRYRGITAALAGHGLAVAQHLTMFDIPEHRFQGLRYGSELADQVLAAKNIPSALIALNDEVAAGALWRLQRAGHRFPEELSIFGFDNLAIGEQTQPALCTVDHRVDATAQAATDLLLELIARGPATRRPVVKIAPQLVIRESAGRPASLPTARR